ncbi:RHS repeat-associated core domain-containing protein, partial [Brevundimonas sp. S30B]|uniref:RHS repeat-associated core domain-containing protein n=2 Tax=unclassified Brevundimonas TaxID=2622653 RepID=UPI0010722660
LGRFLQTDPIGYAAGANLYAYVGADPMNWVDPLGLCPTPGDPQCDDATELEDILVEAMRRRFAEWGLWSGNWGSWTNTGRPLFNDLVHQLADVVVTAPARTSEVIRTNRFTMPSLECRPANSWRGEVVDFAGELSEFSGGLALAAAGGAVVYSPTVVGGVGLGGVAAGAGLVSYGFDVASILLNFSDGRYGNATVTMVGLAFGAP